MRISIPTTEVREIRSLDQNNLEMVSIVLHSNPQAVGIKHQVIHVEPEVSIFVTGEYIHLEC